MSELKVFMHVVLFHFPRKWYSNNIIEVWAYLVVCLGNAISKLRSLFVQKIAIIARAYSANTLKHTRSTASNSDKIDVVERLSYTLHMLRLKLWIVQVWVRVSVIALSICRTHKTYRLELTSRGKKITTETSSVSGRAWSLAFVWILGFYACSVDVQHFAGKTISSPNALFSPKTIYSNEHKAVKLHNQHTNFR